MQGLESQLVEENLALDEQEQVKGEHRAATSSIAKVAQLPLKSSRKSISNPTARAAGVSVSSLSAALRDSCFQGSNLQRQAAHSSLKIAVKTHCLHCEFDRLPAEHDFFFLFLEPAVKL